MGTKTKKNVIYLIADSLRADYLGCYGNDSVLSSEIDELAESGVRFENTVSAAPWTIPSVKSHGTGKYPHEIGIFDSDVDEGETVFDQFKADGYKTALYYDSDRRDELFSENVDHDDWSYDLEALLDFISENKDEPFFIYNLYRGTHVPYTLKYSSEAWHRGKDEVMSLIQEGGEGLEEAKYRYERSIERFSEWYVGAIIDRLRKEDLLEDTAIVITGDHGESWGKRFDDQSTVDLFDLHGTLLYDEALKVPLILYNFDIDYTGSVSEMVRSVDILPTILDALGTTPLRDDLDGSSLLPQLEQGKGEFPEYAFSSTTTHDQFGGIGEADEESVSTFNRFSVSRRDGWKYIVSVDKDTRELYDTTSDSGEEINMIDKRQDIAEQMDEQLRAQYGQLLSNEEHSDEVKQRLEDLGYL
ncbi:sulfatase family protein [Natrinema marinum]|uniref:sulfatase family protein n=1 Tax=Natrinema marinum TaxID=2961598 RepID=UPI0020C86DEE|nr:sulfatase [Natrinema marinum]